MISLVDNVARRLLRRGLRRGLIEGNIWWLCIGAAAGVVRLLFKAEAPKVQREQLALGETITVTHRPAEMKPRRSRSPEAR
ncbi:MAG TPA: hypothetical protein VIJ34_13300 [Acidimicrobiales bacterium]